MAPVLFLEEAEPFDVEGAGRVVLIGDEAVVRERDGQTECTQRRGQNHEHEQSERTTGLYPHAPIIGMTGL